jgi:hypothetical protein
MTTRAKTALAIGSCLLVLTGLGIWGGSYLILEVYPAWKNERLQLLDQASRVEGTTGDRILLIGNVSHGRQILPPADERLRGNPKYDFSRLATTYYHRNGPVGRVLEGLNWFPGPDNSYHADARMPASQLGLAAVPMGMPFSQLVGVWSEPSFAVVLLKDGALASYARPFQFVDFYERSSEVTALSRPANGAQPKFTFLEDAEGRAANLRVFSGPERKTLADRGPKGFYRAIVLDTSRGASSIVSHELMTKEATTLFFEQLTDDGILLVHISSKDYDLAPAVADVAHSLKLSAVRLQDKGNQIAGTDRFASDWVLVARRPELLDAVKARIPPAAAGGAAIQWQPLQPSGSPPWADGERYVLRRR